MDALNWTSDTLGPATSTWLLAVARGEPGWVVVGDGGTILFSANGTTWESVATVGVRLNGVAWGGGRFLAVGEAGTVRTSTDGRNWSAPRQVMPEGFLRGVAYGNGVFLVGGQRGQLFRTADGVAFENLVVKDLNIEALTWDGRFFQAVGEAGLVMQSRDGDRWATPQWGTPPPAMGYLRGVAVERNSLVAVGVAGLEVSSLAAGGGRVTHMTASPANLNAVAGGGGKVVAVGAMGTKIVKDVPTGRVPQVSLATEEQPRYRGQTLVIEAGQVDGTGPLGYQWLKDGREIAGATSDRLVLADLAAADASRYALRVSNASGNALSAELPVAVTFAPPTQFNDPAYRAMEIRPAVGRSGGEVGGIATAQREVELSGTVNSVFLTGTFVAPAALTPVADSGPPRYGVAMLNNSELRGSEPYYGLGISPYFKLPWRLVVGAAPQVFRTDDFFRWWRWITILRSLNRGRWGCSRWRLIIRAGFSPIRRCLITRQVCRWIGRRR